MAIRTICLANLKGGVAKTTSAISIGFSLINRGYRVCFVDMDLQGNLTIGLGHDNDESLSIYEVLLDEVSISDVWHSIPNTNSKIIPGNCKLTYIEESLGDIEDKEFVLKQKLQPLEKSFDFIIIDTGPHFFFPTILSICACDCILVPVHSGFFSLKGLVKLEELLESIDKKIDALFVTQYDRRRGTDKEAYNILKKNYPSKFFKTPIRANTALNKSQSYGQDVISFDRNSNGAKDYIALTGEFLKSVGEGVNG